MKRFVLCTLCLVSLLVVGCAAPVQAGPRETYAAHLPIVLRAAPWFAGWQPDPGWQFLQLDGHDVAHVDSQNGYSPHLESPTYAVVAKNLDISADARITDGVGNLTVQIAWGNNTDSVPLLFIGGPDWQPIHATWPVPDGVTTFRVIVASYASTTLTADIRDIHTSQH